MRKQRGAETLETLQKQVRFWRNAAIVAPLLGVAVGEILIGTFLASMDVLLAGGLSLFLAATCFTSNQQSETQTREAE